MLAACALNPPTDPAMALPTKFLRVPTSTMPRTSERQFVGVDSVLNGAAAGGGGGGCGKGRGERGVMGEKGGGGGESWNGWIDVVS
jgi:hypothetical protein